jgi:hypothetical protein
MHNNSTTITRNTNNKSGGSRRTCKSGGQHTRNTNNTNGAKQQERGLTPNLQEPGPTHAQHKQQERGLTPHQQERGPTHAQNKQGAGAHAAPARAGATHAQHKQQERGLTPHLQERGATNSQRKQQERGTTRTTGQRAHTRHTHGANSAVHTSITTHNTLTSRAILRKRTAVARLQSTSRGPRSRVPTMSLTHAVDVWSPERSCVVA